MAIVVDTSAVIAVVGNSGGVIMTTFTDDQVRQQLEMVLRAAQSQGEARIRTRDGQEYAVRPVAPAASPFDIPGVDLKLSAEEIVGFVREGREKQI